MSSRHQQEADASPGGGAVPTPTPAQGTALDGETLKALTSEIRNAVFAELRRSGQLREAAPEKPAKQTAPSSDVADQLAAIQQDSARMRAFDRACASMGLDDGQTETLEALYRAANVAPDQAREWLSATAGKLRLTGRTTQPTTNATTPTAQARSVSDAGAPSGALAVTEDTPLLRMSKQDRDAWIGVHGAAKYRERMRTEMRAIRVQIGR